MLAVLNPLLKCRLHGRSLYCTACSNASVCTAPFTTMSAAMPELASVLNPLLNPRLQCRYLHGCLDFTGFLFCTKSFTKMFDCSVETSTVLAARLPRSVLHPLLHWRLQCRSLVLYEILY